MFWGIALVRTTYPGRYQDKKFVPLMVAKYNKLSFIQDFGAQQTFLLQVMVGNIQNCLRRSMLAFALRNRLLVNVKRKYLLHGTKC